MIRFASLVTALAGCGFPRPADVIACTPGQFAECRGDTELTCNTAGNDLDAVQCARGCDPGIGCRLCDANQTACTNGKVQSCDASGAVTSSEACALGCFEDQPRCRTLDPSNSLAMYVDMVANPPDLDLKDAHFATDTGTVNVGARMIVVPNFRVPRSGNGADIRVYIVNSLKLDGATIGDSPHGNDKLAPAIAIVARHDIVITGVVVVGALAGGATSGCNQPTSGVWEPMVASGGGGGGNATDGASGGAIINVEFGGMGGLASGSSTLVPLRGGCRGDGQFSFSNGGGAAQLSSATAINIEGTIDARGQDGTYASDQTFVSLAYSGGGSGGSILLEAPGVVLSGNAALLAPGGAGFSDCLAGGSSINCGGAGATATMPATRGTDIPFFSGAAAAGGGGGLGRVRINTQAGFYVKASSTVEDATVTTGVLSTR